MATLNQTVHPTILWKISEATHAYILKELDNALLPYLDEESRFAFVFPNLPPDIFDLIYAITVDREFEYNVMRGHESFATLG